MKIKIELDALQTALDTIAKTAVPASGNITFISAEGKLKINSVADLSRCSIVVPCDVTGDGEAAIPFQAVKDAIKGRKLLQLTFEKSVLTIKEGDYKAELATVDVIPQDELPEEETTEWQLTAEQASWLRTSLKDVALKPTSMLSQWMPAGIKLSSKGAFVSCYDSQHMSWSHTKEVKGDFECVLPMDVMQAIVEVFHKSNFKILQGKSFIKVQNKLTTVNLSVPLTDELPELSQVQTKIKEAAKIEASTITVPKTEVTAFFDNARSIISKERAEVLISATEKYVEFSVKTGSGQVKTRLKGKGAGEMKVDVEYLQELIAKAPADVVINVVEGAFLSMKLTNSTALLALNQ